MDYRRSLPKTRASYRRLVGIKKASLPHLFFEKNLICDMDITFNDSSDHMAPEIMITHRTTVPIHSKTGSLSVEQSEVDWRICTIG